MAIIFPDTTVMDFNGSAESSSKSLASKIDLFVSLMAVNNVKNVVIVAKVVKYSPTGVSAGDVKTRNVLMAAIYKPIMANTTTVPMLFFGFPLALTPKELLLIQDKNWTLKTFQKLLIFYFLCPIIQFEEYIFE